MSTDVHNGYRMFIGGEWVGAGDGTFSDYNPSSRDVWQEIPNATRAEARAAIEAAHEAREEWANTPHAERARYLSKVADLLEERQQEIAGILVDEAGSWIGKGMFETGYVMGLYRAAAAAAYHPLGEVLPSDHGKVNLVIRQPLGVVSVIAPWNFPLLLSSRGLAFALAAGNTVVLKPSEETPVSGGLVIAELFEEAGLPEGVLNVVTCSRENVAEVGDELVANPMVKGVSFTGSTAVGREINVRAAGLLKTCCVELGGKDALIVLDDADMDHAVNAATFGRFMHQGQICMSAEKIIVDESLAETFTERFVERARALKVGDPGQPENMIGPVINQRQLDKIHGQVTEAVDMGAELLVGGEYEGLFYYPTVLRNVNREMSVYREETFGPVAPIIPVAGEAEAIEVANDTDYGLSAGIITTNEERGLNVARRLETGMAHVNDVPVYDEPHVPFGGAKSSGVGRHGGKWSVETFTETRWITMERGGRHYPF